MSKSTFFAGQPVFSQLIQLIPGTLLTSLARSTQADRYYKTFMSRDHLVAMLYACFHNCTSLREVTTGLEASYNKLAHLRIRNLPRRSTLADANSSRELAFFEQLFHQLYSLYYKTSPDSRRRKRVEERLFIMDSTTVTLFSDCMKGVGSPKANGRKKGGVKAHVLLSAKDDVPQLIDITEGARNDRIFMSKVQLKSSDILVFDKGYHNFAQWQKWTGSGISWVTRLIDTEVYRILEERPVSEKQRERGVIADQKIYLGRGSNKATKRVTVRLVTFYDKVNDQTFHFLTNNFHFNASTVAGIYKDRWQIETFFKRFKQTSPVKYFLGDNDNAIKIQLWCAFIKDLLIKIIKDRLSRRWSFTNISSMIRHHLMNYLDLFKFLNNPGQIKLALYHEAPMVPQLPLFSP
jgi:hypothetical protein